MATKEEELEMLQQRYQQLVGEQESNTRQNSSTLRTSQDVMSKLKRENAALRSQLSMVSGGEHASAMTTKMKQLGSASDSVNVLRKQFDDARYENEVLQKKLGTLMDKVNDLEKERSPAMEEDSPVAQQLRILENRLDKALIRYNEAMIIRKTYKHIVKQLDEERIGFDNQLQAIERTLQAKLHDSADLLNMSHEAKHAREVAKTELSVLKHHYEETTKQKEKELNERRLYVQARLEMTQRMQKRDPVRRMKSEESADARGAEEELKSRPTQQHSKTSENAHNDQRIADENERAEQLERTFRQLKEATGVEDVDQIIQKFLSQEDTHNSLVEATREAQAKEEQLNQKKAELKAQLEELKYSGSGGPGGRKAIDEFERALADKTAVCVRLQQQYERLARILINVKQGIKHLSEQMEVLPLETTPEQDPKKETSETGDEMAMDQLAVCEQRLKQLVALVGDAKQPESKPSEPESALTQEAAVPQNNIRIQFQNIEEEDSETEEEEEEEGDVLDRETVKKLANLAVEKNAKKNKRKGKKSKSKEEE